MQTYFDSVIDLQGNAVAGAGVRVLTESRQVATIFNASGMSMPNPTSTDNTGEFSFQGTAGKYFIEISVNGQVVETRGPVTLYDVSDAPPVLATALAASTGAALVGYGSQRLDQFLAGLQSGGGGSSYTLPTASATVLGGVKVGANLSIDASGALSAAAPSAGSSGAWVLLGQATVSTAVANIDFLNIFTSAYDRYRIEINDYAPTANGELAMQVANGGSVSASSTQYSAILPGNTGAASLGQSAWPLGVGILSAAAFRSPGAVLELSGSSTSVGSKSLKVSHAFLSNASPVYRAVSGIGFYDTSPALSGFRLLFTNGTTFKFGTVRVYGLKNS